MKRRSEQADILDVAREAGVSPATVSRALNHPEIVRPDTRERIRAAVDKLGYIRNRAASSMHGARSGAVGLIVPTIDNAIFSKLIQAFSTTLQNEGVTLLIATHGYDQETERQRLRKLLEHRVDGVGLIGLSHHAGSFELLEARETPAVLMWSYADDAPLPCVGSDNFEAGRLAAEHLLSLGHRRIATIFPPTVGNDRAERRLAGAVSALQAARAAPDKAWRRSSRYSLRQAREAAETLLADERRPTAILAGNDILARGALAAAAALGIKVPEALSVIGIGDFSGSADAIPALTTVKIDATRVGEAAARVLLTRMSSADESEDRLEIPLELMARETCRPPAIV